MESLRMHRILLATLFIIAGPVALAQGTGKKEAAIEMSAESRAALVRRSFQNGLSGTLEKYLKPHQYNVQVQFDLSQDIKTTDDVPYSPDNLVPDTFQGLPSGKQLDAIKNLKILVQVPKWVDEGTKKTLQSLAAKDLSEKTGRTIEVGIESVALDVDEPKKNPLTPPDQRAGSPVANPSPSAAPGPPSASAADLSKAMTEIADLKKKVEEAGNQAAPATPSTAGAGQSWISDLVSTGKQYPVATLLALGLLYLGIALIVLIPSASLVSGFKHIRTAFDSLSRSLKSIGDAMGQARTRESSQDSEAKEESPAPAASPLEALAQAVKPSHDISNDELNLRVLAIRDQHKPDYDRIVVDLVLNYLHDSDKSYWAVFLLDIVGREHARRVFESLEAPDQEELMRLVKHQAPEDKIEASLELVEAYQMRLLTFGWKGGGKSRSLDPDIQRVVSQLAFEDIPPILNRLGETGIRRFMLYLDSKAVSQLIRSVRRSPQSQKFLIGLLARMPEAIHESRVDADISTQIKAHFQKKQDDLYLPYLTQYEEIVGQVGDDLEDEMIEQLSAANSEIGDYLRRRLVTMGTFFAMKPQDQKMLVSTFTNSDFATLLSSLSDEAQKATVFGLLEETRKELVSEQLSVLAEESKIVLADRHKEIRRRLRGLLKQLRASGTGGEFGESQDTSIGPRDAA